MKMKLTSIAVAIATCAIVNAAPPEGNEKANKGQGREKPSAEQQDKRKAAMDERKKAMDKRRAKIEAMTPAEKAKLKADMEARTAAWEALSENERKAKMDEMKALYKEHAGDRKALADDPRFIALRAEIPPRAGARGGRPEGRGKGAPEGRGKGKGKNAPRKGKGKPAAADE